VEVVGISGDAVKNHQVFKEVNKLNFTLLADEDGSVAAKFGVPFRKGAQELKTKDASGQEIVLTRGGNASRWTFIIGKDGKIAFKNTRVNFSDDAKQVLAALEKIK
jgi:peroxiredoxin Q/BCP